MCSETHEVERHAACGQAAASRLRRQLVDEGGKVGAHGTNLEEDAEDTVVARAAILRAHAVRLGAGVTPGSWSLRHADARVLDLDREVRLVRDDFDEEVRLRLDFVRVFAGLVPDVVQGIRGIGDQLAQEDLLVGVEGVDDQAHQLLDISIEGKGLRHVCKDYTTTLALISKLC